MRTFVYKKVENLDLHIDVHRADDDKTRPVVVWIHGGALIMGDRTSIDRRSRELLVDGGYAIASIDYRLAPETRLPEILDDVRDAIDWVRREMPAELRIDTRKVAVMGGSAGGYLTLTTGYRVTPRPDVLISLYGYGDLVGDWYSRPSPHPRHHQVRMSREEAYSQVTGPPVSQPRQRQGNGGAFYQFCRQHGEWPKAVTGWDPHTQSDQFQPVMPVRNVTSDFPPTMLIHGTTDTDVPYEQSVMMADELKRHGVVHELVTIPGAEHGFQGGDPARIESAYLSALAFLNRFMAA
jgi:acetyl esterase/lipase